MAVGDIYKLSVVGTFGLGQTFVNTLHYRQEIFQTNPVESITTLFNSIVIPEYVQIINTATVVNTLEARQITGEEPLLGFDLPVEEAGTITGQQLPPQVCPLVSWRTGFIGRRFRGRTYFPAPVEADQEAGQLTPGYQANLQTVADAMIQLTLLTVVIFQLVIFGAANPDVDPPLDEIITPVLTAVVRQDLATQRRRRVGTGS